MSCHIFLMLLLCLVFLPASPAFGHDNSWFELSSRDEVFRMAGYGEEKLSKVLVKGSVNCKASFHGRGNQQHEWPITGVSVAVDCPCHVTKKKSKSIVARGITNEFGDFTVDLPSHLHAIPNLEKICRVKILRIPKGSQCWLANVKRHKGLRLHSFWNGIRTYSAGNLRFQTLSIQPKRHSMRHVQMGHGSRE